MRSYAEVQEEQRKLREENDARSMNDYFNRSSNPHPILEMPRRRAII